MILQWQSARWRVIPQLLGVMALVLCAAACTEQSRVLIPRDSDNDMANVSAVSVVQPRFSVKAGATFAWRTELLWLGTDPGGTYRTALTKLKVKQEIEKQLGEEGFTFVDPTKADYTLVAAVMIGDHPNGPAIKELKHWYPALGPVSSTLDKGMLMVGLSRPGSPIVLWRGVIQTFITRDTPPGQRERRLQIVVHSLLETMPKSR